MTANLAVASQAFAEKIAKSAGAVNVSKENNANQQLSHRKADIENIFSSKAAEAKTEPNTIVVKEPAAANTGIFATPVAHSQFKAAQVAKKADIQNYDAGTVGAKFGGIA